MKRKYPSIVLLVLTILVISGVSALANERAEFVQSAEKYIHEMMSVGRLPGLAVTVVKDGEIIYQEGFGFSNIKKKEPVTPDTLFEIGSLSKAFTALGILQLRDEGKISLDDSLGKYFDWLQFTYQGEKVDVTIRQLLQQTSGIPFQTIGLIPATTAEDAFTQTLQAVSGTQLSYKPGERFHYATINYAILGAVIEKVSGERYADFMETYLFQPLRFTATTVTSQHELGTKVAQGYRFRFGRAVSYTAPEYRGNISAGYILSNGADLGRWMLANLGYGDESDAMLAQMRETHIPNHVTGDGGLYYGMGWLKHPDGEGVFHSGNNPNYTSHIILRFDERLGVAVLTNTPTAYANQIANGLEQIVLGKMPVTSKGSYDLLDQIATILFFGALTILIVALLRSGIIWRKVILKQREYRRLNWKRGVGAAVLLSILFFWVWLIYQVPRLLAGLSWSFIKVWTPASLSWAAVMLVCTVTVIISSGIFGLMFPKIIEGENKKSERNSAI